MSREPNYFDAKYAGERSLAFAFVASLPFASILKCWPTNKPVAMFGALGVGVCLVGAVRENIRMRRILRSLEAKPD
jgi:hypothetical protein